MHDLEIEVDFLFITNKKIDKRAFSAKSKTTCRILKNICFCLTYTSTLVHMMVTRPNTIDTYLACKNSEKYRFLRV